MKFTVTEARYFWNRMWTQIVAHNRNDIKSELLNKPKQFSIQRLTSYEVSSGNVTKRSCGIVIDQHTCGLE